MADPYTTLGVSKSATQDELKSAYRKLAKKLHPDVNPGKKDIEQKFKEVTGAYDLLSDKDKRARFDRGEIDAQGQERGYSGGGGGNPFGGGGFRRGRPGANQSGDPFSQFNDMDGMEDIFAQFMGGGRGTRNKQPPPQKGSDVVYALPVPFIEATRGGKQRVTLSNGKTIDVMIPPGSEEGHKLRLRGLGQEGTGGTGDGIIEIHVQPHAYFSRKDNDIILEAPVSLPEALLGATINVPTLDGEVSVKVPKNSNTGTTLRLKGKGVPTKTDAGDMFVKLKIMLPETIPEDLSDLVEKWAKKHNYDPRKKLGW